MNKDTVIHAIKHYLIGLLASSWNGAIGGVAGILGVDGASMTGLVTDVHVLNLHEMMSAFCGAFVLHGILWLKAHPVPESFDTTPPFSETPTKPNP